MRVLVFGSTGQVARALGSARWPEGALLMQLDRQAADLSRPESLGAIVRANAPDAVIIAAAYTNVDGAESETATAMTVNAIAPGAIAEAAAVLSIPVVFFSTDYVFDGSKDAPYDETDATGPINAYGRSKLAGEEAVRAANERHLILRTSWVYGAHGRNFLRTMLRLAETSERVRVVADQHGCPTAAGDIAGAVAQALPPLLAGEAPAGTYHVAGGAETSWHGFAEAIFAELAVRGLPRPECEAISSDAYPSAARRPKNSRLSSTRFAEDFGIRLPGYPAALPGVLDAALASAKAEGRHA